MDGGWIRWDREKEGRQIKIQSEYRENVGGFPSIFIVCVCVCVYASVHAGHPTDELAWP